MDEMIKARELRTGDSFWHAHFSGSGRVYHNDVVDLRVVEHEGANGPFESVVFLDYEDSDCPVSLHGDQTVFRMVDAEEFADHA